MKWLLENWFSLFSCLAIVFFGGCALVQWRKGRKLKRAKFIGQIFEKLRFDDELIHALYLIDYDEGNDIPLLLDRAEALGQLDATFWEDPDVDRLSWYNSDFHGGSKTETAINKLLSYLSYIQYLIQTRHITTSESSILEYELNRVCKSWSVKAYLFNLYHFSAAEGSPCSFQHLVDLGRKKHLIDHDFFDPGNEKYPHRLNF